MKKKNTWEDRLKADLKKNRSNQKKGKGDPYWDSVVAVVKTHINPIKIKRSWTYTLDGESRFGYIKIGLGSVAETIKINDAINIDLDGEGTIVGVEVLK